MKKPVHLVRFTLCPKEGDFQMRVCLKSTSGMFHFYKTAQKCKSSNLQATTAELQGQQKGT